MRPQDDQASLNVLRYLENDGGRLAFCESVLHLNVLVRGLKFPKHLPQPLVVVVGVPARF
jgi:hypothetical protein